MLKYLDRQMLKYLTDRYLVRQLDIYRYLKSEIDLWLEGRQ